MKMLKLMMRYIGVMIISIFIIGCEKTPKDIKDTVVAKIGNEEITLAQIDEGITQIRELIDKKDKKFTDEELEQIAFSRDLNLQLLINSKIKNEKAKSLKLCSDEQLNKEVDQEIQTQKERKGLEIYKKDLKYLYGKEDEVKYRQAIKGEVISQKIVEYLTKDINISDEDARKHFEANSKYGERFEDAIEDIKKELIHDETNKRIKNAYEDWKKELNVQVFEENLKLVY